MLGYPLEDTFHKDSYIAIGKNNPMIRSLNWNDKAKEIFAGNNRWWFNADGSPTGRPIRMLSMLIKSELAEAMEGERKNLNDDHLPMFKMFDVELADTLIRVLDFGAGLGYKIDPAELGQYDFDEDIDYLNYPPEMQSNKIVALDCLTDSVSTVVMWVLSNPTDFGTDGEETQRYYIEEGLSILVASILNVAYVNKIDLIQIMEAKLEYNRNRADHKPENRAKEGGKAF